MKNVFLTAAIILFCLPRLLNADPVFPLADGFEIGNTQGTKGFVAFSAYSKAEEQIYFIDLEQSRVLKVTSGPGDNSHPAYSPDGTMLAFLSDRDGDDEVFVSSWDGTNQTQVTFNDTDDESPAWSADGQILYYSRVLGPTNGDIFFLKLSDIQKGIFESKSLFNAQGQNTGFSASFDGKSIAYTSNRFKPGWDICLYNLNTESDQCILGDDVLTYCKPKWARLSGSFIYSQGQDEDIDLYLYNANSGNSKRITSLANKEYEPAWSGDDKHIFFSNNAVRGKENYQLKVMELSSSTVTQLLKSSASLLNPTWTEAKPYTVAVYDLCAEDPLKTWPGSCGCGVSDQDDDLDGYANCIDECPSDYSKALAGVCGCGRRDPDVAAGEPNTCISPEVTATPIPWVPEIPKLKILSKDKKKRTILIAFPSIKGALYEINLNDGLTTKVLSVRKSKVKTKVKKGRTLSVWYKVVLPDKESSISQAASK